MLKNVTSANAYTELQGFTRKLNKLIGTNDWMPWRIVGMVTPSKASNQRDRGMTYYIIKEENNALFGDCYFGGPAGYTTDKNEAERFDTKEEARDVLMTRYFTKEDVKSLKVVKVKE